jgi:DNA-binding response OmpR family regulator
LGEFGEDMKRILVVDDEPDILNALKASLERQLDYEVDTAGDGEEALKKLEKSTPDLIILDLIMPKINGEDVLRMIRKNYKTMNTPVIVSTVRRETSALVNLMNLGATDYLMKPYDIKDLNRVVGIYI